MKLVAATGNKDKLLEFSRILSPLGIEVLSPAEIGIAEFDVSETGDTFAENAAIKAKAMFERSGLPSFADDSGLCIDALDGRPGVYSARYLDGLPQDEKNLGILKELANIADENRTARFICNIHCILRKDKTVITEGACEGEIAHSPSGDGGFGYDPIFLYDGKSFASLSDAEKDKASHRGIALRELAEKLEEFLKIQGDN